MKSKDRCYWPSTAKGEIISSDARPMDVMVMAVIVFGTEGNAREGERKRPHCNGQTELTSKLMIRHVEEKGRDQVSGLDAIVPESEVKGGFGGELQVIKMDARECF